MLYVDILNVAFFRIFTESESESEVGVVEPQGIKTLRHHLMAERLCCCSKPLTCSVNG